MTLAGSRPRYQLGQLHFTWPASKIGRVAFGLMVTVLPIRLRGSNVVSNASAAYLDYGRIVVADDEPEYSRRLRRLAVMDAVAINSSIKTAKLKLAVIFWTGTLALGGGLMVLVIDFRIFDWRILALLICGGLLQSAVVLPSLYNRVSAVSPGLQVTLAFWGAILLITSYFTGPQFLERSWSDRSLSLIELINISAAAYVVITIATVALAALTVATINFSERRAFVYHNCESTAIFELMWAASLLNRSQGRPVSSVWRWAIVDALQQAADAIEFGIARQVPIADLHTRELYRSQLQEAADTVRSLQSQALLEHNKERCAEVSRVAYTVAYGILMQDYSMMPALNSEERQSRRVTANGAIRRKATFATGEIAKAVGPVAIIEASSALGLLASSVLSSSLSTLAIAWLIVKLIALIEPNYREMIGGVQSLLGASESAKK